MMYDPLTNKDVQGKKLKRYREHEADISIFQQQVINWIIGDDRKLSNEFNCLPELGSRQLGSTCIYRRSKDGAKQTTQAHEKDVLTALLVEQLNRSVS
ncbi:hypothetical protein LSH36_1693g00003 [Paralvinella palmiformis]|uniref:Uncharacterized protein n=1 Tax=Paralvinella palmiformis TaxID=53620 RepID=A0AAD9MPP6_9ANNE|nr:hypothetical protein LSH36_1693g00003 [Paralvinella palmiformis]